MNNLKNKILFLFIFSLALFNSFAYLNSTKIMEWDEARRGVAAYEMLNSGNWFVSTYRGATDYWSTKPPLGLWTIAASYKLFGANRFALRFPSALAAFLTIVLIAALSTKIWGDKVGMVSALVLTTSPPFFLEHAARAGEYDALLALLISAVVFVVLICKQSNGAAASIGILLGLIVLLKSFAVTIPIFILTFYFVSKRSIQFPDPRKIVISIICASLIISFWAIPRALEDGLKFFSALWENDLVARTMSAVEGHERSWYWYITRLFERSPAWMILLFLGLIFGFRKY